MKIRNVNALLLTVLLFGAVASCDSGSKSKEERLGDLMDRADEARAESHYADAGDYYQAIVGLQTEVLQQGLYVETNEQLDAWIETLYTNKKALEKLVFSRNDYNLRSSMVDLFTFYISYAENQYRELFELMSEVEANPYDEELQKSLVIRFEELHNRYYSEVEKFQNAAEESERDFVTAYDLDTVENPINEDIIERRKEEESVMEELKDIYDTQ